MTNQARAGPSMHPRLTPKQEKFVREYLVDMNATKAVIRAGYSAKGASVAAARLLADIRISAALRGARDRLEERIEITAAKVLDEIALLAFSDVGEILDMTGSEPCLKRSCDISPRARRMIQSVKVKRYLEGNGEERRTVEVTEFKLWSKDASLEKLAKHFGLWKEGAEAPDLSALLTALGGQRTNGSGERVYDA